MPSRIDWTAFSADPRARSAASVRACDADRQAALAVLAEAYADGRLDRAEYDTRSSTALTAVLLGDLRPLLQDLEPPVPARAERSPRERAVAQYQRERRDSRNTFVMVTVVTTGIWAATSLVAHGLLFFWPVFPIVVLALGWLGQAGKRETRTEHLEQRFARRDERRRRRRGLSR